MNSKKERVLKVLRKRKYLSKSEKRKLRFLEEEKKEENEIVLILNFKKENSFDLAGKKRYVGQKNIFRFRGGKQC